MWAPKSHNYKSPQKKKYRRREHQNKKFYNSKAWRETRSSYLRSYQTKLYRDVAQGFWITGGHKFELSPHQQTYILQFTYPCEICLKLYCAGAYDTIKEGKELDHIEPLNPENALQSDGFGDPFDHDNLQMLCRTHHAKKSQRETKI